MAFPSVIVECAFNSTLSETSSAATGYTDITKFVDSVSGTLRGRSYELDDIETGSISITLDNSDGRFTPGSPLSPYYPYVKANRRLRIRGKNMQRLNIGRAGGQSLDTDGFHVDPAYSLDAADNVTRRVTDPVVVRHNPVSLGYTGALLDEPYHIEGTLKAGAAPGGYRIISYYTPVELGVRSTHSAYVWRVSGTEPSGTLVYLVNSYYDANGVEIVKEVGDSNEEWNAPTPGAPARRVFSDLPPGNAAYMIQSVAVLTTQTTTQDITYAINGIQTEIPTGNLVPSISGYYDYAAWQLESTGDDDPGTVAQGSTDWFNAYVRSTWGTETVALYTTVPHLVPGDDYTFVCQVRKSSSGQLLLTGDDGQSGAAITTTGGTWQTVRTSFRATSSEHEVKIIPSGAWPAGAIVDVRLARCAAYDPNLPLASTPTDTDETEWSRPIPVFEGWVERWPVQTTAFSSSISITVNDRLKKLGDVVMESTLKQTIITDNPALLLPLDDNPDDNKGAVSILGDWSDDADVSTLAPMQTKFGAGSAQFLVGGLVGPSEEDALQLAQVGSTQGYVFLVPYTYDYTSTPAAPVVKPPPIPKRPPKANVSKTFYATWSRPFQGSNAQRTGTPYIYQGVSGFVTENYGNQKSLIGFNWKAIRAWLKEVTPVGVTFGMYAVDWGNYSSGTAYIGFHTYGDTAPATWNTANVAERQWKVTKWPRNAWRTVNVSSIGKGLKAGTIRGISVGHGDGNKETYGTFHGATFAATRPFLTISGKMPVFKTQKKK